jgi:tetratricopeptide (TPR) repeat protein
MNRIRQCGKTAIQILAIVMLCGELIQSPVLYAPLGLYARATELESDKEYEATIKLGEHYEREKDFDHAIASYRKAAELPHGGFDEVLFAAWERLLARNPFDVNCRIGLGETYEQQKYLEQAELEYQQAKYLSPGHKNAIATRLLARVRKLQRSQVPPNKYTIKAVASKREFENSIRDRWSPPQHDGFLLTRCKVYANIDGDVRLLEISCPSGSKLHDQSALDVLKSTKYTLRPAYPLPYMFDFAFASQGDTKIVGYSGSGDVEELDLRLPESKF